MLHTLDNKQFFSDAEITELRNLGLWKESHTTPAKLAFAGLLLAPVMEIVLSDNATSNSEFERVQKYLARIEREFAIASSNDLESIGMDMGLLPMVKGSWNKAMFKNARTILAGALDRLKEGEAGRIRGAIATTALEVAQAGSPHLISLHQIDSEEGRRIREIASDLKLETTPEGLHLLGKAGDG